MAAPKPRDVLAVLFDDLQILDVTGPLEVFSQATRMLEARGKAGYRIRLVSARGGTVATSSGLALVTERWRDARRALDILVVPGGRGTRKGVNDEGLVAFIARAAARSDRVMSICTGAFLLAQAGLLDGRVATTHWDSAERLAATYPNIRVEADRVFVKDGNVYTSAGVTAGIDLALALVTEDHGKALALEVARQLVVFLQRPGGQSQFSAQLRSQSDDGDSLGELRAWMEDHVGADLSVPALARRARMSPRSFARHFVARTGTTPARYVQTVRLDAARRRLEQTSHGLDRIAAECGLGTAESLRRAFASALGTTPSEYRERFATNGPVQ